MSTEASPAPSAVAPQPEEMLTVAEVAVILGKIHVTTVYRLIRTGELRAHRMGGGKLRPRGVRVPRSAVDAYLRASEIEPPEQAAS